jgi:hypothetical protein
MLDVDPEPRVGEVALPARLSDGDIGIPIPRSSEACRSRLFVTEPPAIISYCVWLYYRFGVSLRDVSELMLARGIEVSHDSFANS